MKFYLSKLLIEYKLQKSEIITFFINLFHENNNNK